MQPPSTRRLSSLGQQHEYLHLALLQALTRARRVNVGWTPHLHRAAAAALLYMQCKPCFDSLILRPFKYRPPAPWKLSFIETNLLVLKAVFSAASIGLAVDEQAAASCAVDAGYAITVAPQLIKLSNVSPYIRESAVQHGPPTQTGWSHSRLLTARTWLSQ